MINRIAGGGILVAALWASSVFALAPDESIRPEVRKGAAPQQVGVPDAVRPSIRPASAQIITAAARPAGTVGLGPDVSLYPWARPDGVVKKALSKRRARRKGAVCGDPDLQGDVVGYVPGRISGCGIKNAVRIRSVSGITLSQAALINCDTAKALKKWVEKGMSPALRGKGKVAEIKVAAHYSCRTRNNQPGAKISEHGKGNAIDISGFRMANGLEITVLRGWDARGSRRPLRKMHKAACGPFGTVLGPDSDRFHRDHFHFDTARHRGGPYCR
jgi:hypothetical protein